MPSPRDQIVELIERGAIPANAIGAALAAAGIAPNGQAWRTFIDRLLLWLGGLALAFAVLFFVAYNWRDIGRFAKFALVETLIVLAVLTYWKRSEQEAVGKVSLLVATITLGVLLALYGQTYQTGADTWQLFFAWAMLTLPWAFVGRFAAIWIVWVVLINLAIVLYHQTFRGGFGLMFSSEAEMWWLLFLFNALALVAWELLARSRRWLAQPWAVRLLAAGSGIPMTWLALHAIFDQGDDGMLPALAWAVGLAALLLVYRRIKPDLFMLAGGCLSGIVVAVAFAIRFVLDDWTSDSFLLLALLVIGLGTGAAIWLRNVHREELS